MPFAAALPFASWAGALALRAGRRRPWLEPLLLLAVALFAWDLVRVGRLSLDKAFLMQIAEPIERAELFEHVRRPRARYRICDWQTPVLPSMLANRGVIECYGIAAVDADREAVPMGALGADEPDYRGRAWVSGSSGEAEIVAWSPNRAVVRYRGASPGASPVRGVRSRGPSGCCFCPFPSACWPWAASSGVRVRGSHCSCRG